MKQVYSRIEEFPFQLCPHCLGQLDETEVGYIFVPNHESRASYYHLAPFRLFFDFWSWSMEKRYHLSGQQPVNCAQDIYPDNNYLAQFRNWDKLFLPKERLLEPIYRELIPVPVSLLLRFIDRNENLWIKIRKQEDFALAELVNTIGRSNFHRLLILWLLRGKAK